MAAESGMATNRHVHISIRKQLELQHPLSSAASPTAAAASNAEPSGRLSLQQLLQQVSSSTPTSPLCSTVGQIYAAATGSPMRGCTPVSSTPTSSSHYAQISPLRGVGVPNPGGMGTPTYFQVNNRSAKIEYGYVQP